eukprot:TRINITY_DN9048_c0_g1_i2.p2 TRINITY_DN9048_c0_g1~~TRINITY_DN9048_c0_g1_i2.p2  ORF type:complete len:114 (+),score=29.15 TRINITY_DN9048_c0_g1_i2:286-627(+)
MCWLGTTHSMSKPSKDRRKKADVKKMRAEIQERLEFNLEDKQLNGALKQCKRVCRLVEVPELYHLYAWFSKIHLATKGETVDRRGRKFKAITLANLKQFLLNLGVCVIYFIRE